MLRINTLGGLAITRDGEAVTQLGTRKVAALLVYLAYTERAYAREVLAELLWEERTPRRALGNLRVALTSLRKHLGDYVLITHDTVAINLEAEIRLDVRRLEALLQAGQILAAVALHHGGFLQGFFVRGAPAFDNWAARERERLHLVSWMPSATRWTATWTAAPSGLASSTPGASWRWIRCSNRPTSR
jgi:DNA-binding SARP family transcriptional activator